MEDKKYIIIEERGVIALSNKVCELIEDGYYPFGNMIVTSLGDGSFPPSFCQPMMLNELKGL